MNHKTLLWIALLQFMLAGITAIGILVSPWALVILFLIIGMGCLIQGLVQRAYGL